LLELCDGLLVALEHFQLFLAVLENVVELLAHVVDAGLVGFDLDREVVHSLAGDLDLFANVLLLLIQAGALPLHGTADDSWH